MVARKARSKIKKSEKNEGIAFLDSRTQKVCILKKKDLDKELKKLHNKMSAMLSKIEKLGNYNLDGVDISLGVSAGLLVFDVKGGVTLHYKHKK